MSHSFHRTRNRIYPSTAIHCRVTFNAAILAKISWNTNTRPVTESIRITGCRPDDVAHTLLLAIETVLTRFAMTTHRHTAPLNIRSPVMTNRIAGRCGRIIAGTCQDLLERQLSERRCYFCYDKEGTMGEGRSHFKNKLSDTLPFTSIIFTSVKPPTTVRALVNAVTFVSWVSVPVAIFLNAFQLA